MSRQKPAFEVLFTTKIVTKSESLISSGDELKYEETPFHPEQERILKSAGSSSHWGKAYYGRIADPA